MKVFFAFIVIICLSGCNDKLDYYKKERDLYSDSVNYYNALYDKALDGIDSLNFVEKKKKWNYYFRMKMNTSDSFLKYSDLYTTELKTN